MRAGAKRACSNSNPDHQPTEASSGSWVITSSNPVAAELGQTVCSHLRGSNPNQSSRRWVTSSSNGGTRTKLHRQRQAAVAGRAEPLRCLLQR